MKLNTVHPKGACDSRPTHSAGLSPAQKAAIAAIEKQQKHGSALAVGIGTVLLIICRKEPESARRVLDALTGGTHLGVAAAEVKKRSRESGVEYFEIEEMLREIYGLDEPLEDAGEVES